jgi:hypothetical protein
LSFRGRGTAMIDGSKGECIVEASTIFSQSPLAMTS